MITELVPALKMFLLLTIFTGLLYPISMTGIAQVFWKANANGSLVYRGTQVVGSELIGQEFKEPKFFHSRPSGIGYNPMPSGATNLGPTSADLLKAIAERRAQGASDDLLFASASGLDPHISPEAAAAQVARIAHENKIDESSLLTLVQKRVEKRTFGFLGEPRVNVLLLNLDLLEVVEKKR
jgi:K+-transporting ATPase ATPase C chain